MVLLCVFSDGVNDQAAIGRVYADFHFVRKSSDPAARHSTRKNDSQKKFVQEFHSISKEISPPKPGPNKRFQNSLRQGMGMLNSLKKRSKIANQFVCMNRQFPKRDPRRPDSRRAVDRDRAYILQITPGSPIDFRVGTMRYLILNQIDLSANKLNRNRKR